MAFPKSKASEPRAFQKDKPPFPVGTGLGLDVTDNSVEHDIDEIEGKLIKLFEVKQAGRSTVQNATLQTKWGDIKIAYWGGEIPKDAVMQPWRILATADKFGKITYKIEEYESKKLGHVVSEVLSIGNKAEWEEANLNQAARQAAAPPEQAKQYQIDEKDMLTAKQVVSIAGDTVVDNSPAGQLAYAARNLADQHRIVFNTVCAVYEDTPIKDDMLQAFVSTIWIGLDRAGCVHPNIVVAPSGHEDAPQGVQTAEEGQHSGGNVNPDYDPSKWAFAIVPSGSHKDKKLGSLPPDEIEKLARYALDNRKTGGFWSCVHQACEDFGIIPF